MDKDTLLHLITIRGLELGLTERQVSTLALGDPDGIRNWRRKSDPLFSRVVAVLKYLDIPFEIGSKSVPYSQSFPSSSKVDVLPPDAIQADLTSSIPLWGEVSAGGGEHQGEGLLRKFEEIDASQTAPPPFHSRDQAAIYNIYAVKIRGQSMNPVYNDGDLVYFNNSDPLRNNPKLLIGRDCAVTFDTDADASAIYLKRLRWPDNLQTGFFNLESINQQWPTLTNIPVTQVVPVRFVRRKVLVQPPNA